MQTLTDQILIALKQHGPMTARQAVPYVDADPKNLSSLFSKLANRQGWVYCKAELEPHAKGNPHSGKAKLYALTKKGHKRVRELLAPDAPVESTPQKAPKKKGKQPSLAAQPNTVDETPPQKAPKKKEKQPSRAARELESLKAEIASRESIVNSEKSLLAKVAEKEPIQPWEFDPATDPVVKTLKNVTISFDKNRLFTEGREHAGRLRYLAARMESIVVNPNVAMNVQTEAANTLEWLRDTADLIDKLTETSV